jgi:hypothetical protein
MESHHITELEMQADRNIYNIKPGIIIRGDKAGTYVLIYVAIYRERRREYAKI